MQGDALSRPKPLYELFGEACLLDLACFMNVRNLSVVHVSASLVSESAEDRIRYDDVLKAD